MKANSKLLTLFLCLSYSILSGLRAEPAVSDGAKSDAEALADGETEETGIVPSWQTQKGAKTVVLTIPAPRGQIVDRGGRPLATNRVAYFPALKFPHMPDATDEEVGAFGMAALEQLNILCFGSTESDQLDYWIKEPKEFIQHHKNRRWLPFLFVGRHELTDLQKGAIGSKLASYGLVAHPGYVRHYPRGKLGCHIVGYTGLTKPLPTGPLENGDPMFYEWEGKSGLEASLDDELKGTPGKLNIIFDKNGNEMERDMLQHAVAGSTVVLTLDANMQKLAEDVLYYRSSLVVVDCQNGEILALGSNPGFNPNDFVPSISQDEFSKLIEDENKPLVGRAFQFSYPPASTFKVPITLAALKEGTIRTTDYFDCPERIRVGAQWKKNWHQGNEGKMTLQKAIARSCNTWFYTVGQKVGAEPLVREARNFGFGQLTKIPLEESPGLLPTNTWMMENHQHHMYLGDVANFAIGQGFVEATPLQVAQSMTGIANGSDVWRARLIKQKQNHLNEVIELSKKESIGRVEMAEKALAAIRRGMVDVVHAGHGTGRQGYCTHAQVAAKTGTAQWRAGKQMTWFAGFLPADDPQFAFAVAFEGGSSGGKTAAPIAKEFFNSLYARRSPQNDLFAEVRTPGGTKVKEDASGSGQQATTKKRTRKRSTASNANSTQRAEPAGPAPKPRTLPAKPKKRSLWDRIRGR
jgi:penicillin-binding protein 2